jgi:hypothetical protein
MLPLQVGQLSSFRRMVGEFVVGESGTRHEIASHWGEARSIKAKQRRQ